ncbi:hypothetical protein ACQEVM_18875 [Streptomyces sp. CA-243310]|uniref:hypothetical protein n=1 Tax=Streptomyces sp. CA-243310 TaxID=3240056 RepID=UPI003D94EFE1
MGVERERLTVRESAAWDQLVAGLRDESHGGSRARPDRRARRRLPVGLMVVMATLLCAALALVAAAGMNGEGRLVWAGVAVWIAAIVSVSYVLGHGPHVPLRR